MTSSTECGIKFSSTSLDLEDTFSQITVSEEDEIVEKQQAKEDLQLYGSRPLPQDFEEAQESTISRISVQTLKRTTSECEITDSDRRAKFRKDETWGTNALPDNLQGVNNNTKVTAVDWNGGDTPLDAWLNQSAVPSTTPISLNVEDSVLQEVELASQEVEEIEVFRNVHIPLALDPSSKKAPVLPRPVEDLDCGAQIYYRNIMDKYPSLPVYLARRLAEANLKRAERLWSGKHDTKVEFQTKHKPVPMISSTVAAHTSGGISQPVSPR